MDNQAVLYQQQNPLSDTTEEIGIMDCYGHVINRLSQKCDYIFDVKDDAVEAYLVAYDIDYYVFNKNLMSRLIKQVMIKLDMIYNLDSNIDPSNEKLTFLKEIKLQMDRFGYDNNPDVIDPITKAVITNNTGEDKRYYNYIFNRMCKILGLVNTYALFNLVIDYHIIPYTEDARGMLC